MFLINKVSSKRTSRDFTASESVAAKINSTTAMEFNYAAPPMNEYTRPRTKRQSRSKSAFFGSSGGRSSFEEVEGRTSTRSSVNEKDGLGLISIGMKKKLRKAASKASFSPASPIREETERRPLGLRRVPESWSRKLASPSSSSSSISSSASAAVGMDSLYPSFSCMSIRYTNAHSYWLVDYSSRWKICSPNQQSI